MSKYDLPDKYDIHLVLKPTELGELRQVFKTALRIHNDNDSMPLLLDKWQRLYTEIQKQMKQSLRVVDTNISNSRQQVSELSLDVCKEEHIFVLKPNEFRELKQVFKTAFRIHNNNDSMPLLLTKWQELYTKIAYQYDHFIKHNYDGTGKIVGEDQSIGSG